MKVSLYIEGQEVELNESVQFLLNKQFENVNDPTTIINEWSKTVSIPFTELNNKLFGYLYKPERIIKVHPTKTIGMYFDPTVKLSFQLLYNSTLLMSGYAKMNQVKQNGASGVYEVTLFGTLGKIFSELKKITFDKNSPETDYIINGSDYFTIDINKSTIYNCWYKSSFASSIDNATALDVIGFAPNNYLDDGFDYKSFLPSNSSISTFQNVLDNTGFEALTGVAPSSVIENGMTPRGIGEYRSYLQVPYIFFDKLFLIFLKKAENITGYKFDLDSGWFNDNNEYWKRLVMLAERPYDNTKKDYTNYYNFYTDAIQFNSNYTTPISQILKTRDEGVNEQYPLLDFNTFELTSNDESVIMNPISIRLKFPALYSQGTRIAIHWKITTIMTCTIDILNASNNAVLSSTTVSFVNEESPFPESQFIVKVPDRSTAFDNDYNGWDIQLPQMSITYNTSNVSLIKVRYTFVWNQNGPYYYGDGTTYSPLTDLAIIQSSYPVYIQFNNRYGLTINDFWNKDHNIFTEILNYCKIFRIGIFVDDIEKKVKFIPFSTYFSLYTVEDWTEKVDYNKELIIKPITFEKKYIKFNYKNSDLKNLKQYLANMGLNYGEKRIITNYNFNSETAELFKDLNTSIVITEDVLSWTSLYNKAEIVYTRANEYFVLCGNDEKKYVKQFGNYFFWHRLKNFDTGGNMRGVVVSDDTFLQESTNTKCYSQDINSTAVIKYPLLSNLYNNKLTIFNKPNEKYSSSINYDNANGIYDLFWNKYINERYNIQNKIVTCYLKFTPTDWQNFEFNHFIIINGMLYMINKIYDYNIETSETTKVDLVSITDILGYTS